MESVIWTYSKFFYNVQLKISKELDRQYHSGVLCYFSKEKLYKYSKSENTSASLHSFMTVVAFSSRFFSSSDNSSIDLSLSTISFSVRTTVSSAFLRFL